MYHLPKEAKLFKRNRGLYIDAMRNKAELYVMMGKEQEAFKQFANAKARTRVVADGQQVEIPVLQ